MISRRDFCQRTALLAGAGFLGSASRVGAQSASSQELHLACNQYVWQVFYQRDQKSLDGHLDAALGEMASAGLNGFEPGVESPGLIDTLAPLLEKHGLEMRSVYVNSTLHEPDQVTQSLDRIVAVAQAASKVGTRIIVTNPSPIRWGGEEDKDDGQLECQAAAMDRLGKDLRSLGLVLAYHNHDIELRQAAREFHHMMIGTDPGLVGLCLDAHWIYRGSGHSSVALFDMIRLYGPRICELHLRQSRDHVWTESMGEGDIDYPRLAAFLAARGSKPHLVLEQAVEAGSPHTMDAVEAHRKTVEYARVVFAGLG